MEPLIAKSGALSVTCACGAYLEIDIKFAGQTIQCPDCQKLLTLPTLEKKQTSGFALASLVLALLGFFTFVGPLVAMVLGFLGLRSISANATRLAGRRVALAGIVLGGAGLVLSVGIFLFADRVGLDGWLREIAWAAKLDYSIPQRTETPTFNFTRPSPRWGLYRPPDTETGRRNDFLLVHPREEAYFTIFEYDPGAHEEAFENKVIVANLMNCDLITLLHHGKANAIPPHKVTFDDSPRPPNENIRIKDLVIDMTLGGREWTFAVRVMRRDSKRAILAGVTSKRRFARLKPQFDQMFTDTYFELKRGLD